MCVALEINEEAVAKHGHSTSIDNVLVPPRYCFIR
jgi:hypothetical protein